MLTNLKVEKLWLLQLVKKGRFREDLYYRLNVFPIQIPPLRERKNDIKILVDYFMRENSTNPKIKIEKDALEALEFYFFPGNVRELRNIMERLVLLSGNQNILLKHIPYEIINDAPVQICPPIGGKPLNEIISEFEIQVIKLALHKTNNNKAKAAELLEIPSSTLRSKIEKLGIPN